MLGAVCIVIPAFIGTAQIIALGRHLQGMNIGMPLSIGEAKGVATFSFGSGARCLSAAVREMLPVPRLK